MLNQKARCVLAGLDYRNIFFKVGDGSRGWEDHAPYDGIIVTAAAPDISLTWQRQLKDNKHLVVPIGGRYRQELLLGRKIGPRLEKRVICDCAFVPLIGEEGWSD